MPEVHAPSRKDEALFEALLKQGCSTERAARIAHAPIPGIFEKDSCAESATKEEWIEAARKG